MLPATHDGQAAGDRALDCASSVSLPSSGAAIALAGGGAIPIEGDFDRPLTIGLDRFVLNLLLLALVFVPLERAFPRRPQQTTFRFGWTTDGTHFLVSHLALQVLTFMTLVPSTMLAGLWHFHAVHHSSRAMDWLAGSRLHVVDVVITRGLVILPVFLLGFSHAAVYSYLVFVGFHAVFIHANVGVDFGVVDHWIATPRMHHWHHAITPTDRNFAVHLPVLDRVFGTLHSPERVWPEAYGIDGHPMPEGWIAQFVLPFHAALARKRA